VNDHPAKAAAKPAPKLADYPHRVTDTIRFGDLDPQGHVNQAVFLTYFESGRVAMFRDPDLGIGVPGLTFVLVRMEVDYMKELHWPGSVDIGTGVTEFGRTSF
jgi:acyl-CoA thioester hydrolase